MNNEIQEIVFSAEEHLCRGDLTHACAVQPSDSRAASSRAQQQEFRQQAAAVSLPSSCFRHGSPSIPFVKTYARWRYKYASAKSRLVCRRFIRPHCVMENDVFLAGEFAPSRPVASCLDRWTGKITVSFAARAYCVFAPWKRSMLWSDSHSVGITITAHCVMCLSTRKRWRRLRMRIAVPNIGSLL